MTGVVEGNGAQLGNREAAATTRAKEVRFFFMRVALDSWANYLMRNNSVEYINNVMGHRFVEYQRGGEFMGVAFGAKPRQRQQYC
jgi:hypothetical protein